MLAGLTPPDPSLTDGVVTLRMPDAARDAPTLAIASARSGDRALDCDMWSLLPGDAGPDQPPA